MRLFDSHCHVHDERIPDGTDGAVQIARDNGVARMITVGCDRATSLAALGVASRHADVSATVGLHPHEAHHTVDTIVDLFQRPDIVAVGEAGLDYYYDHSPRDAQRQAFADQIQIAHTYDLPLVIHTRDAWDDTFDVLHAEGIPAKTVFHCFTGGPAEARRCLDVGAYLSFSGIVTFKSAHEIQAALSITPDDHLLIETDAPYLAPVPHRGKSNRPAWVADVAKFIADFLDRPADEIAAITYANGTRIFGEVTDDAA